jgi:hypothetical protein
MEQEHRTAIAEITFASDVAGYHEYIIITNKDIA